MKPLLALSTILSLIIIIASPTTTKPLTQQQREVAAGRVIFNRVSPKIPINHWFFREKTRITNERGESAYYLAVYRVWTDLCVSRQRGLSDEQTQVKFWIDSDQQKNVFNIFWNDVNNIRACSSDRH